jgi:hypothetical protein
VDSDAILYAFAPIIDLTHTVTLEASAATTATWPTDVDLRFDVEFTAPDGTVYTPAEFRFRLLKDVTL